MCHPDSVWPKAPSLSSIAQVLDKCVFFLFFFFFLRFCDIPDSPIRPELRTCFPCHLYIYTADLILCSWLHHMMEMEEKQEQHTEQNQQNLNSLIHSFSPPHGFYQAVWYILKLALIIRFLLHTCQSYIYCQTWKTLRGGLGTPSLSSQYNIRIMFEKRSSVLTLNCKIKCYVNKDYVTKKLCLFVIKMIFTKEFGSSPVKCGINSYYK